MSKSHSFDFGIFASNEKWEMLTKINYKNIFFQNLDHKLNYCKENKHKLLDLVENNTFITSRSERLREDFLTLCLIVNQFASNQYADVELLFHAEKNIFCLRIYSPVFMVNFVDNLWLLSSFINRPHMQVETTDGDEALTRISLAFSFDENHKTNAEID